MLAMLRLNIKSLSVFSDRIRQYFSSFLGKMWIMCLEDKERHVSYKSMAAAGPEGAHNYNIPSSCHLIETKASICSCVLRKGVNQFASWSKITFSVQQESTKSLLSVVCPPSWSLCFYSAPAVAFKTVCCRLESSLLKKRLIEGNGWPQTRWPILRLLWVWDTVT